MCSTTPASPCAIQAAACCGSACAGGRRSPCSVPSHPAPAAAQTLRTRAGVTESISLAEADALGRAVVLDQAEDEAAETADTTPGADPETGEEDSAPRRRLVAFARDAETLEGAADVKLTALTSVVKGLLADGYDPIVFCRFLATADYVGDTWRGSWAATRRSASSPAACRRLNAVRGWTS